MEKGINSPDSEKYADFPDSEEDAYFSKIPDCVFRDELIIKMYGERLLENRLKRGLSQEKVAELLGIDHDAVSKIESGLLKKIDRNILVLLCGLFQVTPEAMLGLNPAGKSPMEFDADSVSGKPQFIVNQLVGQAPDLLEALLVLAKGSKKTRAQWEAFLYNTPKIKILKPQDISALIKNSLPQPLSLKRGSTFHKALFEYINTLAYLGTSNLRLLDAYVSIAAMKKEEYSDIFSLLQYAGFWPLEETKSDRKIAQRMF